ncbi:MAG TPA: ABC transporter substrate-binding protein [candidate division Zixibacteria bacterium]|nr:ABC transporter substrate-binding protein [candidate division Zixibacteria bacterium]
MRSVVCRALALLAATALAAAGDVSAAAGGKLSKVRFVQSGHTASSWPIYVAQQRKILEKNGIELEVIVIRGATNTTRAVLSETIPIGRINPDYVIGGIEKGARVRILSGNMEKIPYDVIARPEIKSGADLKGKTIGVSTLTGGTTNMIEEVLEKAYKLKPSDYKYLVVGTSPDRYAAIKGGSVQATFMGPPFNFRAIKEGFTKLITFHEILGPIQFTVDFAHMNYIKSNRNDVVQYLRSIIEATEWLYDRKNKEEAIAIHMKVLKSQRDIAEQDYRYLVEEFQPFPRGGAVNKIAMEKTIELRVKEGLYKGKKVPSYTEFVDNSLIEEAQKLAGFKH